MTWEHNKCHTIANISRIKHLVQHNATVQDDSQSMWRNSHYQSDGSVVSSLYRFLFVNRGETGHFHFHNHSLKPFILLHMTNSESNDPQAHKSRHIELADLLNTNLPKKGTPEPTGFTNIIIL